jgi:Protein of unknown function (DUF2934)
MSLKTMTSSVADKKHEAIESEQRQSQSVGAPRVEEIRQRAYEIHLERGGAHGWDQDDWLQAERDLTRRYQTR